MKKNKQASNETDLYKAVKKIVDNLGVTDKAPSLAVGVGLIN